MWAGSDVCGLLAANVGPFAANVGLTHGPFAANVGRVEQRLWASRITFVGRYTYRRRTNMYAKNTGRLQERLDVYWIVHNFVRVHFTTHQVPAVALGVLEYGFSLNEIFLIQKVA